MAMQGIPCLYYGTENGLSGHGNRREYVREALWGYQDAFSPDQPLFKIIQDLSALRNRQPPLRFGRQYFRLCSGNQIDFGYSAYPGGVIAFSRILNDRELLVVANTNTRADVTVHVAVDYNLNPQNKVWNLLFSTNPNPSAPAPTASQGSYRTVKVSLSPLEAQVLG
jgi:glycosidase